MQREFSISAKCIVMQKLIAETENVDKKCLFIIETAALTHDIGIHVCEEKYGNCNGKLQEQEGPAIAERLLKN